MIRGIIKQTVVTADLVTDLVQRDAVLWLAGPCPPAECDLLAAAATLTWRLVLCEDHSKEFLKSLTQAAAERSVLERHRGFVSVIARDPEGIQLPPRSLPVYLMNGRADAADPAESIHLSARASQRRSLNMTKRLVEAKPSALLVFPGTSPGWIDELKECWEEGVESRLAIVTEDSQLIASLEEWVNSPSGPASITVYTSSTQHFITQLLEQFNKILDTSRLLVRVRAPDDSIQIVDATPCEQAEYPVLDRYELICERDLKQTPLDTLPADEFAAFFERSRQSWKPYAAGLPWVRDPRAIPTLLRKLEEVCVQGHDATSVLTVPCEPGAGGTTFARQLAYAAAYAGFPTLVANQARFDPNSTELSTFLYRLRQEYLSSLAKAHGEAEKAGSAEEVPALIVFDVQHWLGREEHLLRFSRDLMRESRAAVVLAIVTPEALDKIPSSQVLSEALQHQISQEQAIDLGTHLNRYLAKHNRARTGQEWLAFWNKHTPGIGAIAATPASFWLALEFWLKFQLDISESIQSWLFEKYTSATLSEQCRKAILHLAAISIERHTLPETMLPVTPRGEFPLSVQLEEARKAIPALGLLRLQTADSRQWCIGHALLARYLLSRLFHTRAELDRLGLGSARDPVELRLILLRQIATAPDIVLPQHRRLAIQFAQTILKLDRDGNREFFVHWRKVLNILESMPDRIWDTSRTFNHHVAISRRRVVNDRDYFTLSMDERVEQIKLAIEHLEYALNQLEAEYDDERDLNILNSLARAYHDYGDLLQSSGAPAAEVKALRDKASETVRRALNTDPNNSFVLETVARDLLEVGPAAGTERVRRVCEALSYVYRAMSLESAALRSTRLSELVVRALELLRASKTGEDVKRLRLNGNPLGNLACAWLQLFADDAHTGLLDVAQVPRERQQAALNTLRQIPAAVRTWMDLHLEYELVSALSPYEYLRQLELMDELIASASHPDIQTRVEYGILLYQCGRAHEATALFRELRREIAQVEAFVVIPDRLRVLRDPASGKPVTCEAIVFEESGFRSRARIKEFGKELIPFIPRDFGQLRIAPGSRFRCSITFGPNGPFVRPART